MAKQVNARILHKHDIEANWLKAAGFTPGDGELVIYDEDNQHPYKRVKIGDGSANVNDLPFFTDNEIAFVSSENIQENYSMDYVMQDLLEGGMTPITGSIEEFVHCCDGDWTSIPTIYGLYPSDYEYYQPAQFIVNGELFVGFGIRDRGSYTDVDYYEFYYKRYDGEIIIAAEVDDGGIIHYSEYMTHVTFLGNYADLVEYDKYKYSEYFNSGTIEYNRIFGSWSIPSTAGTFYGDGISLNINLVNCPFICKGKRYSNLRMNGSKIYFDGELVSACYYDNGEDVTSDKFDTTIYFEEYRFADNSLPTAELYVVGYKDIYFVEDCLLHQQKFGKLAEQDLVLKGDLEHIIRASLDKADTALQSETDPTVPSHVKAITADDIANWNKSKELSKEIPQHYVLAAPSYEDGEATFRRLEKKDIVLLEEYLESIYGKEISVNTIQDDNYIEPYLDIVEYYYYPQTGLIIDGLMPSTIDESAVGHCWDIVWSFTEDKDANVIGPHMISGNGTSFLCLGEYNKPEIFKAGIKYRLHIEIVNESGPDVDFYYYEEEYFTPMLLKELRDSIPTSFEDLTEDQGHSQKQMGVRIESVTSVFNEYSGPGDYAYDLTIVQTENLNTVLNLNNISNNAYLILLEDVVQFDLFNDPKIYEDRIEYEGIIYFPPPADDQNAFPPITFNREEAKLDSDYNEVYSGILYCTDYPNAGFVEVTGNSLVVGSNNTSKGKYELIAGRNNTVLGIGATALGAGNTSIGENAVVAGNDSTVSGANAASFGNDNVTTGSQGFTAGLNNTNRADVGIALGQNNVITEGSSNSAALGKDNTVSNYNAAAINEGNTASGGRAFAANYQTIASGNSAATFGFKTEASGEKALAAGQQTKATAPRAMSGGYKTVASGKNAVALGGLEQNNSGVDVEDARIPEASGENSLIAGTGAKATAHTAISLGKNTTANGQRSVALCNNTTTNGNNSLAAGNSAVTNASNSISLGDNVSTDMASQVTLGKHNRVNTEAIFLVGSGTASSRKHNAIEVIPGANNNTDYNNPTVKINGSLLINGEEPSSVSMVTYNSSDLSQPAVILTNTSFDTDNYEDLFMYVPNSIEINGTVYDLTDKNGESNQFNPVEKKIYTPVTSLRIRCCRSSSGYTSVTYKIGKQVYSITYQENGENWINIPITDDVIILSTNGNWCLTGDTLITMADGTYKRIDEIQVGDMVKAIDPATNKITSTAVTYSDAAENKTFECYDKYTFSDGTIIKTVARHKFYNIERQKMVYMDEWDIGEHAYNENGELIELVAHERVDEEVAHYTIFTELNTYFANELLSGNRFTAPLSL